MYTSARQPHSRNNKSNAIDFQFNKCTMLAEKFLQFPYFEARILLCGIVNETMLSEQDTYLNDPKLSDS